VLACRSVVIDDLRVSSPESAVAGREHDARGAGVVNCVAYERGTRLGEVDLGDIQDTLRRPETFIWIGLVEPAEWLLRAVQNQFGLHDLAVEDALHGHQRPKLERYQDSLFVVLRTVQLGNETRRADLGETHIFVGARYIVTVRHGSQLSHVGLRGRCESVPQLLGHGPAFVLYALMDFVVDQYFPIVDALEDELEALEHDIFSERFDRGTMQRIYRLKRDLLSMKRAVAPLIDICNRLIRFDLEMIPEATRPYFRDVYDHVVRINEMIDSLSQLVTTALEANLSLMSVAQNDDTKRLAAWAAIIAVPTMVAGLYGMNFSYMPELHWKYGYPVVLALMTGACLSLYYAFKRTRWL
jgi:magnesium transporter